MDYLERKIAMLKKGVVTKPPHLVGLVACAAKKSSQVKFAKDLYTSQLFQKSRRYVETACDEWFILSAKHGLVNPNKLIEPYDEKLSKDNFPWAFRVSTDLKKRIPKNSHLIILAGKTYYEPILPLLQMFSFELPLSNLGIGKRIGFLTKFHSEKMRELREPLLF